MIDMDALRLAVAAIRQRNARRSMLDINTAMALADVFIVKVYSIEYEFGSIGDEYEFSTLTDAESYCLSVSARGYRTTLFYGRNGPSRDY